MHLGNEANWEHACTARKLKHSSQANVSTFNIGRQPHSYLHEHAHCWYSYAQSLGSRSIWMHASLCPSKQLAPGSSQAPLCPPTRTVTSRRCLPCSATCKEGLDSISPKQPVKHSRCRTALCQQGVCTWSAVQPRTCVFAAYPELSNVESTRWMES